MGPRKYSRGLARISHFRTLCWSVAYSITKVKIWPAIPSPTEPDSITIYVGGRGKRKEKKRKRKKKRGRGRGIMIWKSGRGDGEIN